MINSKFWMGVGVCAAGEESCGWLVGAWGEWDGAGAGVARFVGCTVVADDARQVMRFPSFYYSLAMAEARAFTMQVILGKWLGPVQAKCLVFIWDYCKWLYGMEMGAEFFQQFWGLGHLRHRFTLQGER